MEIQENANGFFFLSPWQHMIDAIVATENLDLFQQYGFKLTGSSQRATYLENNKPVVQFDIIAQNSEIAVVIEVRTKLTIENVNDFLEVLPRFTEFFSAYREKKIYGAVAGVNIAEKSDRYAYKRGLFVLTLSGEGTIKILNDDQFEPKNFHE